MQTSLFTGISGLNANMSALSVIGNNIANLNTVGFKGSRVSFEDVLNQSVGGSGASEIGLGVKMAAVERSFGQGAFETTTSGLDLAISGDGFFILSDPSGTYYSRAGQFHLDKDGYLVNPSDLVVQGYVANSSGVLQNSITDIQLSASTIEPSATTLVTLSANLDSNSEVTGFVFTSGSNEDIRMSVDGGTTWVTADLISDGGLTSGNAYSGETVAGAIKNALEAKNGISDQYTVTYDDQTGKFSISNPSGNSATLQLDWTGSSAATILGFNNTTTDTIAVGSSASSDNAAGDFFVAKAGETSNFSVPVTVYDSLGNEHLITLYFRKDSLTSNGNVWDWYAVVDSDDSYTGTTQIQANGSLTFNMSGALYSDSGVTYPTGGFDFSGGGTQDQAIDFDFGTPTTSGGTGKDGVTQYGTTSAVTLLNQDGYAAGSLQRININSDGLIEGVFSNGRSRTLAQVLLATFPSTNGLSSAGRSLFMETYNSGQPLIGEPGSAGKGTIQPSTLELSNVDLASEFINMITAQRGFQANSRIITTTDEILSELVNLKR